MPSFIMRIKNLRFHIPPTIKWDPDELVRRLRAMHLNATTDRDLVLIRQGPYEIRNFPCVWRRREYEPTIRDQQDEIRNRIDSRAISQFRDT